MNVGAFNAWTITDRTPVNFVIPTSPVGPIFLRSWHEEGRVPVHGSAILLPLALTTVDWPRVNVTLDAGCYALAPANANIAGGRGLMIHTPQYVGLPQLGGPAESGGRLKYIDGCSDSLLICPAQRGEPCLNLLHLPAGTDQTQHTHPSDRIGIILRGGGVCRTPDGETALTPGMFWYIPAESRHSFHTYGDYLDVFAWHPDSDFGPSHDEHPMVNRTIVEGVAANDPRHAGIRTT